MSQQSNGFFNRRFTVQAESSPPILHNAAGNDFKRLIEKSRNKEINHSIAKQRQQQQTKQSPSSSSTLRPHGFAVGEPIILPLPPNYKRPTPGVLDKVYDWLFTYEDRYFNNDRNDLSQDIFPANDYQNSIHKVFDCVKKKRVCVRKKKCKKGKEILNPSSINFFFIYLHIFFFLYIYV